ncbi:MAG: hypothetical protein FWE06_02385 [Oscillospiraceae bacterium]|nr:hypothetical protein [Oscillospiraceae bacterium]
MGTIKCAECGVRLSVRVKYKQHCVKRWSRALKFFSGILAAIAFVVFWESTGSDAFFIPFLLTILVLFFLPGILFSMPVALGRRKKIFAVMDMDEQRSSEAGAIFISAAMVAVPPLKEVAFDIQAQLDFTGMACPEHVVYDYSTYDLRFSSDGESYPVLLGIAVLNGEVKYFELEFLGKTYGIIRPDIKEGQAFELEDYKGNHIHGVITKIYKST